MSEVTVKQFADVVGIPVDRLLAQLGDAGLRKSNAVGGEHVHCRCVQVCRAVAIGVQRALVVGQDKYNVGSSDVPTKGCTPKKDTAEEDNAGGL